MSDATKGTDSPDADGDGHLAHVDRVVGCVEMWEDLSAYREEDREPEAE